MPFTYKKEDFDTSEPYADLMQIDDFLERQVQEDELREYASSVGLSISSFNKRLKAYKDDLNPRKNPRLHEVRMTDFTKLTYYFGFRGLGCKRFWHYERY